MPGLISAYLFLAVFFLLDRFIRKGKTAKSLKDSGSDNKSTLLIVITFFVVLILSAILNLLKIGSFNNEMISVLGLSLMALGLMIRIISMRTLSKYYTRVLITVEEQEIVKTGIYKYIRHPGYLGTILVWSAAGLAMQNKIVFIAAAALIFIAYYYRISNEENMLIKTFGEKYIAYKKHSWRLIPFVW